jgi:hypothetical protein
MSLHNFFWTKFSKQVVWVQDIIKQKNSSLDYREYMWFIHLICLIASNFKHLQVRIFNWKEMEKVLFCAFQNISIV